MQGIHDLRPIATAPVLEELFLDDLAQRQPDDLRPLVGHPTLRAANPNLGGRRKSLEARAVLGLPEVDPWKWRCGALK